MKVNVKADEIPFIVHHLRPRGNDIIHIEVGGELADGSDWIPTQDDLQDIVDVWLSVTKPGNKVKVVVTPKNQKATVKSNG